MVSHWKWCPLRLRRNGVPAMCLKLGEHRWAAGLLLFVPAISVAAWGQGAGWYYNMVQQCRSTGGNWVCTNNSAYCHCVRGGGGTVVPPPRTQSQPSQTPQPAQPTLQSSPPLNFPPAYNPSGSAADTALAARFHTYHQNMDAAKTAYDNKDYQGALLLYQQANAIWNGHDDDALFGIAASQSVLDEQDGDAAFDAGDYESAIRFYSDALNLEPGFQAYLDRISKARSPAANEHVVLVGTAGAVRGTVYWLGDDGKKVPISSGNPIFFNKRVITEQDSHVQLLLVDGTVFTLGPNADMVIDDFVFDPSTSVRKASVRMIKGLFRWTGAKAGLYPPENSKVKLAVGTIGIRGTDFEVSYQPSMPGYIKLYEGELLVTPYDGSPFTMQGSQIVTINNDGSMTQPQSFAAAPSQGATQTIELAAGDFTSGQNVALASGDDAVWGTDSLLNAPPHTDRPNAAEWHVTSPAGGNYDFSVRYAAAESRPVDIYVNGTLFRSQALAATTGCWTPDCRQWIEVGVVTLKSGDNVIRFQRSSYFPHLNRLRFMPALPQ